MPAKASAKRPSPPSVKPAKPKDQDLPPPDLQTKDIDENTDALVNDLDEGTDPDDLEDGNLEEEPEETPEQDERLNALRKAKKPEPLPNYEEGVNKGVPPVDMSRLAREQSRAQHETLDMGPVERQTERPLGYDNSDVIDALQTEMAQIGPQLRIRVTRIYPDDAPPGERGQHPWIDIPEASPTRDDVVRQISDRYGGGRYSVEIADKDLTELANRKRVNIEIGGNMIPVSDEGRMWYRRKYEAMPGMPAVSSPSSSSNPLHAGSDSLGVIGMMMQMQRDREQRDYEDKHRGADRETNVFTALVPALVGNRGGGFAQWMPLIPIILEFLRGMREDGRRERAENDARLREITERTSRSQGPAELLQLIDPILKLQQKRGELEMEQHSKYSSKLFDEMLNKIKESGNEEDATWLGTIKNVIAERGGDMVAGLMPLLSGMMRGVPVQTTARQLGVDPNIVNRQALPPRTPQPRQVRPQAPAVPGAPTGPGPVSQAPTPPTEAAPAPEPVAPEVDVPAPVEPRQPAARLSPAEFARAASMQAMEGFLYYARGFAEQGVDPVDAWGIVLDGQAIEVMFGMCPPIFRTRLSEIDTEKPFLLESVVEGFDEKYLEFAREFDAFLQTNATGRQWMLEFLDEGPWADEEDDGA